MGIRLEKIVECIQSKDQYLFQDKTGQKYRWNTTVKKEELQESNWYLIKYTKRPNFTLKNNDRKEIAIKNVFILDNFGKINYQIEKKISKSRLKKR